MLVAKILYFEKPNWPEYFKINLLLPQYTSAKESRETETAWGEIETTLFMCSGILQKSNSKWRAKMCVFAGKQDFKRVKPLWLGQENVAEWQQVATS